MTPYTRRPADKIVILQDDREKEPWTLPWDVEVKRLKVGDYTIRGYENVIAVEKKRDLRELLDNLTKQDRPRFKRFLKKMEEVPLKCIVVGEELSYRNITHTLQQLKEDSNGRSKLTIETVKYWIVEMSVGYGIPMLFVSKQMLNDVLRKLFPRMVEKARELK